MHGMMFELPVTTTNPPLGSPQWGLLRAGFLRSGFVLFNLLLTLVWPQLVAAVPADPPPRLCIGFDPTLGVWGMKSADAEDPQLCPADYAFLAVVPPPGERQAPAMLFVKAWCCPLPLGTLTAHEEFVPEVCPERSVATGVKRELQDDGWHVSLRCTALAEQYHLGTEVGGRRVEYTLEYSSVVREWIRAWFGRSNLEILPWEMIPVGVRWGLGRLDQTAWLREFCIGDPVGSVFVAKHGKSCAEHSFRTILRADGTPLPVIPQCRAVLRPYSPDAECVP